MRARQTRCSASTFLTVQPSVNPPLFISVRASRGASSRGPTWWWWPSQTETCWCRPGGSRPSTPAHSSCCGDSPGPGTPRSGHRLGQLVCTRRCHDLILILWLVMMSFFCSTAGWTPAFVMFPQSTPFLISCTSSRTELSVHPFLMTQSWANGCSMA